MKYEIYDHTGKLIESGETDENEIIILREGPEEETN
jgi:hypothetical protein